MNTKQVLPEFDKLWNYNDPHATELKFRELLPDFESAGDPDQLVQLLTQIARTEGLQGRFDDAHATLDRVEVLLAKAPELGTARSRYLLERGRVLNSSGRPQAALPFFVEAQNVAGQAGAKRHLLDAIHMIAIAKQDPQEQIEWNLKGIAIAESDETQQGWLHAFYNNIGESYAAAGDHRSAFEYFTKLAELQKRRTGAADLYTLKDQARMLRLMGSTQEALAITMPLLQTLQASGEDNGWVREEIAEAMHATGETALAKEHFVKAYEILAADEYCQRYEPAKLERLRQMCS